MVAHRTFIDSQFDAKLDDVNDLLHLYINSRCITDDTADRVVAARLVERQWADPDEAEGVMQMFWDWLESGRNSRAPAL
jgi:hypothetical protein